MLVSVASSGFEIVEMHVGPKMVPMKVESEMSNEFEEEDDVPSLGVADGRSDDGGIGGRERKSGTILSLPGRETTVKLY